MRLCIFFLVLLASQSAASQTSYKWTGGASGSWQTPTNWTPQGVPGATDNVLFETSADVTLAADTRVNRLDARGIQTLGAPGDQPTFPNVTVSSAAHRFVSVGSAFASRGTLTVTARVDTCGSAVTSGSNSFNPAGQLTLQNVGGVGTVGGGGRGVSVSGSALRIGDVGVGSGPATGGGGGPTLISGTVLSVGNVAISSSLRDGPGTLIVTSTPIPGGTRFGNVTFNGSGTIDLRIANVVIGTVTNGPTYNDSNYFGRVLLQNADVVSITHVSSFLTVEIGGTLHLGSYSGSNVPNGGSSSSVNFSATQAGAAVVFGAGASASAPATLTSGRTTSLANGLGFRIAGPTLVNGQGGRFQLSGGTFTVASGARLRLEAPVFELAGAGTFDVEGELSVAPGDSNPGAVSVSVPTRLAGLLDIDLSRLIPGETSRVSFAGLTAGGALALTYPGGTAPYPPGTTFTPFTYTSVTGAFNPVTFPALQGNTAWAFALEPTRARLAVVLGQAPNPVPDDVSTDEDIPVSFDPASNDTSTSGGPLTTVAIGASALGTATLAGGTVTFTPTLNASGEDTVPYTVRGSTGLESTGQVRLVVRPVNDAPLAADDAAQTQEAALVQIDVLANDTDVDGPALTIASVQSPAVGNAFPSEGRVLYSPPVGFTGTVTFGYVVSDGALSDEGQITVVVSGFGPGVPATVSAPSPNPSSGEVAVSVSLPSAARVTVDVYDALGRRVGSAASASLAAGEHAVALGSGLAPGAYVYRVRVEGEAAPFEAPGRFVVVR